MDEIWVDVINFDGLYEVSNLGRFKSLGRWVANGKSERWVKEKIRKNYVNKDGRVSMILYDKCIATSVNAQAIVYFSFNRNEWYKNKTYCVAHIDKIKSNNRLDNLKLIKISESHTINFEKKLLPHLANNSRIIKERYDSLTEKKCATCNVVKPIIDFERGRNNCKPCRKISKNLNYIKNKVLKQGNTNEQKQG